MAIDMVNMLRDWVASHPQGQLGLLPQNLGQGLLDALTEESAPMLAQHARLNQKPEASPFVTAACLMLLADTNQRLTIHESALSQALGAYTRAIHLESLRRKGVIKELRPEFSRDNICDANTHFSFELTELGRTLKKQESDQQPFSMMLN